MVKQAPSTNPLLKICTALTSALFLSISSVFSAAIFVTSNLHGIRGGSGHFHCQKTKMMHTSSPTTKVAMTFADAHGYSPPAQVSPSYNNIYQQPRRWRARSCRRNLQQAESSLRERETHRTSQWLGASLEPSATFTIDIVGLTSSSALRPFWAAWKR